MTESVSNRQVPITAIFLTSAGRALAWRDYRKLGLISLGEPGEKAAVARITPFMILTELNSRPLKDVDEYQKRIEAIQQAEGGGTAVIKILIMGKSRMVRIVFP